MNTMTISGISNTQTAAGLSLISGTTYDASTSVSDVMAQGQGIDEVSLSKGGQQMSQLKKLQATDPDKFKEAAQKISDQLTEKAKDTSDSNEASKLTDLAAKFADAAKTGSMDGLKPQAPPSGITMSKNSTLKFKSNQDSGGPMATVDSVISDVLSDVGASTTSTSVSATESTAA
jgi:hypothetical protein